jgi:hypothetical protein
MTDRSFEAMLYLFRGPTDKSLSNEYTFAFSVSLLKTFVKIFKNNMEKKIVNYWVRIMQMWTVIKKKQKKPQHVS